MKSFYNSLSKPAQDNIACFLLFFTMMCSVFFVVTVLMGHFFVAEFGTTAAFVVPVVLGAIAVVCQMIINTLEV